MSEPLRFSAEVELGRLRLDAAFDVAPGETLAVVGPSGAGKSTCLALVAGLLAPRRGRVSCGEVWCDTESGVFLPPYRRRVGLLFQEFALFPHLDVAHNVAFGARARGLPDAMRTAREWLDRLGLGAAASRSVASLSGGERQRVALARALAAGARVLLLDEPFGALDLATRAHVRGELRRFLHEIGLPTVIVTHDPLDALIFGDRVAVLEDGRVAQAGPGDEVRTRPRTPFAAELSGLNLYRGEVAGGRGLKGARVGPAEFHVLADDLAGPVFVAFGAAEVTLSAERLPGSAQNAFRGTVTAVLPLPDRLRVVIDTGLTVTAEVTHEAAEALGVAPGRVVWATVKASAIHVYA